MGRIVKKQSDVVQEVMGDFDVAAFQKMQAEVQQRANAAVAKRVEAIVTALYEIREICVAAKIEVDLHEITSAANDVSEQVNPDWSSSSQYC